jgi:biopolymer transport protein ExbD
MHSSSESGEPNLTPILDMVFQLITFFMLVINFQAAAVDMSLKLPVVGSARPIDTHNVEELLVLNVTTKGEVMVYGQPRDPEPYLLKEAQMAFLKLKGKNPKAKLGDELPTMIVVRADQRTPFDRVNKVLSECQKNGFRKFALRAMNATQDSKT